MATTVKKIGNILGPLIRQGREDVTNTYTDLDGDTTQFIKGDLIEYTTDTTDMAAVPDNADATVGVSANFTDFTGVVIGDVVLAVSFNAATSNAGQADGMVYLGHIHDAANCTIVPLNGTAAAVDPATGIFTVLVMKNA